MGLEGRFFFFFSSLEGFSVLLEVDVVGGILQVTEGPNDLARRRIKVDPSGAVAETTLPATARATESVHCRNRIIFPSPGAMQEIITRYEPHSRDEGKGSGEVRGPFCHVIVDFYYYPVAQLTT